MGQVSGSIRLLADEEMALIHHSALRILDEIGMRIDHAEARFALLEFGCRIKPAGNGQHIVTFPPEVVEKALHSMRRDFSPKSSADHDPIPRYSKAVPMRYTGMYFSSMPRQARSAFDVNTGGFTPFVYDLDGQRRAATMQDVRDSLRLADALENIDMAGLPCAANEVSAKIRPVVMAAELVKHTGKIGGIEAWSVKDIDYISKIATVVAGDDDRLRKNPILIGYGEARTPLCLDENMAAIFIEYIRRGMPQSLDTMPAGGTTAPATSAGTLTLGIAETLAGLTLGYAIDPQAVISLDVCPTLTDMRSMIYPYAGADRIPLVTAAMQMLADFYGRPGGCHGGKTDACIPGAQAGIEKALSIIFPVLAGATGVGTLGHVENALTFSFEQLVIDNEIAGYIKRMLKGFEVSEETIAFDVIREVGPGGNFLQHPHTAENFRKEFWVSNLMERLPWEMWNKRELKGLEARAREKARKILAQHHPEPLNSGQVREIDAIVAAATNDPWYQ
jgi:trimethylamine---corrinoid protein Co-methyltransferase